MDDFMKQSAQLLVISTISWYNNMLNYTRLWPWCRQARLFWEVYICQSLMQSFSV